MGAGFLGDLQRTGMAQGNCQLFDSRRQFSVARISELERNLKQAQPITAYPDLTIFAAGSYARGEASIHSDIDLFFIHRDATNLTQILNKNLKQIKVMSAVIDATQENMKFPAPSNDGQYLKIASLKEMLAELEGPEDDHTNAFTTRMLLLLESIPVFGNNTYNQTIDEVIEAYFRDYEDHIEDFRPIFLVNDVLRFWKTLCLNYEHRRNKIVKEQKAKQKIRNFKLQYSRLMTCFSTVALLSSYKTINKEDLVEICKNPPIDRLLRLTERQPSTTDLVRSALNKYYWFLEKTSSSKTDLETYFSQKNNVAEAFKNASKFGDDIFRVVEASANHTNTLRYLVV